MVVSGTWKYDDPRLKMSHEGAIPRTTVCHMFCRMTKMAAWEFFLQDGGVSESFTHKMVAWENCLQDGGNPKQTKRKQKQRRICIMFTV